MLVSSRDQPPARRYGGGFQSGRMRVSSDMPSMIPPIGLAGKLEVTTLAFGTARSG
jgi:hypothetical protein